MHRLIDWFYILPSASIPSFSTYKTMMIPIGPSSWALSDVSHKISHILPARSIFRLLATCWVLNSNLAADSSGPCGSFSPDSHCPGIIPPGKAIALKSCFRLCMYSRVPGLRLPPTHVENYVVYCISGASPCTWHLVNISSLLRGTVMLWFVSWALESDLLLCDLRWVI